MISLPVKEKSAVTNHQSPIINHHYINGVCRLLKEKVHFVSEFWESGNYFFIAPSSYDAEVVKKRWNPQSASFIATLADAFEKQSTFTSAETEALFKATAEACAINPGQVMQLFRVCISGVGGGPMLFEMTELLGKEEIVNRLRNAHKQLSAQE